MKDSSTPLFAAAYPYLEDVLALPVENIDQAATYYGHLFGLVEVERRAQPPAVIMERDGVQIGFAVTGGDANNDGAAILVTDIERARREVEGQGAEVSDSRVDEHDGKKLQVFFVRAPDGLCFYFHQPVEE